MSDSTSRNSPGGNVRWWEPYVFTSGLFVCGIAAMWLMGQAAQFPLFQPALFVMITVSTIWGAIRQPYVIPTVWSPLLNTFILSSFGLWFLGDNQVLLGVAYLTLAVVWLGLTIHTYGRARRMRRERAEKLQRAVETLRHAVDAPQHRRE